MDAKNRTRKRRSTYYRRRRHGEDEEAKQVEGRGGLDTEGGGGRDAKKKRAGNVQFSDRKGDLTSTSSPLVAGCSSSPLPGDAGTNKRTPRSLVVDDPLVIAPGAVAVRGPGYCGNDDSADLHDGDAPPTPARVDGGADGGDNGESSDALLRLESYAVVRTGRTDEEIRQHILSNTARAEVVTTLDEPKARLNRSRLLLLVGGAAAVVIVAVAVGAAVPLARRSQGSSSSAASPSNDDGTVVASVKYLEWQRAGGFAGDLRVETRLQGGGGVRVTSGLAEAILCRPAACLEGTGSSSCAADQIYTSGCCAGSNCSNETQCGYVCPYPPDSCFLTNPSDKTCTQSRCYTCQQDGNGTDLYHLEDYAVAIDCLEVGTAIRKENQQEYKWAIFCGPVILGPVPEENRDLGEYQCGAARLGANFSDDHGGLMAYLSPCQFFALAECGCGPSDMNTIGLPEPSGPCRPGGGCPLLCEDAGPPYARNVCRAFPGNISWWEGQNAFNRSLFLEDKLAPEYEFEIYIKGIDSSG
jgi:hypothetical protein